jgi:hypothetical protein
MGAPRAPSPNSLLAPARERPREPRRRHPIADGCAGQPSYKDMFIWLCPSVRDHRCHGGGNRYTLIGMKRWMQFGSVAVGAFIVIGCLVGAASNGGLFGAEGTTILAGLLQAAATVAAVVGSFAVASRGWRKERDAEKRRIALDAERCTVRAFGLVKLVADRMEEQALSFRDRSLDPEDLVRETVNVLDFHCAVLERFPLDDANYEAARALEEAFIRVSNNRRWIGDQLEDVMRSRRNQGDKWINETFDAFANDLNDAAAAIRERMPDMLAPAQVGVEPLD